MLMYVMHYLAENVSCNVNERKIAGHKISEVSEVHRLQRSFFGTKSNSKVSRFELLTTAFMNIHVA